MDDVNRQGSGFKIILSLILAVLTICACVCTYKYIKDDLPPIGEQVVEDSITTVVPTSVEDAIAEWEAVKETERCYDLYLSLPTSIVEALFKKLGTDQPWSDYVHEYERNREYYISLQIADQLQDSGLLEKGVDGDKINSVSIKTEVKPDPVPEKTVIPAVPDSVQVH